MRPLLATLLLSLLPLPPLLGQEDPSPQETPSILERNLTEAVAHREAGQLEDALTAVGRALEADDRHLGALRLLADIGLAMSDQDLAAHALHRWTDLVAAAKPSPVTAEERGTSATQLGELDPEAKSWERLQASYVKKLLALGKDYKKSKDWLGALEVFSQVLQVDPDATEAAKMVGEVRRLGGREVAVEDVFAGADPLRGKTPERLERENRAHSEWPTAWKKSTTNYRFRTDAGYLVLETASIAMEQMNRFYRKFFRYKLNGGKTPKIEIRIFKNRSEYLDLGSSPSDWSGGQFTGSAVETYVGGTTGRESIRDMYRTLFHEAAHQFVTLSGRGVPGWLNEAFASFFEGCVILSNGTVEWNRVPPGRLFPLASRLDRGWMQSADDGVRDDAGEWAQPTRAPRFAMVVSGDYEWGPPWYAPTWGVVYFLYNYRAQDGRPVFRDALHEYYTSFKRGRPKDPVAHFEEIVVRGSALCPVSSIDGLDKIWRNWILDLRDVYTGRAQRDSQLVQFGDSARERGDLELALEFYEDSLQEGGDADPEVLKKIAGLFEDLDRKRRAAATYRQLKREYEVRAETDHADYRRAAERARALDPLAGRFARISNELAEAGLELAKGYEERGLPTMALEIARRMSASFSVGAAREYYADLARRTGKSLARWRLAYDGLTLNGWSGGFGAYRAAGDEIVASFEGEDPAEGSFLTRELAYDATFDADFSLEAEMRIEIEEEQPKGRLMGLCFGWKGAQDFHAVTLHPKGFMDIATNRGGVWEIRDHRTLTVGSEWLKLRIDVTGSELDVYLDDRFVRSLDFRSRETVRGGFGLITGTGEARYRQVRVLARDRFDPAAAIERELAMERISEDASLRADGNFAGFAAPELKVAHWAQGDPITLEQLKGEPVLLAFWSQEQEKVIPTAAYYRHLTKRSGDRGLRVIVLCDGGTKPEALAKWLETDPLPGALVGIDVTGETYEAYWVKAGGHGIPRVLLIDRNGIVQFEGDPGLRAGEGWRPGAETYVDGPLRRLLAEDH
ncbi:MAG: redoxin domain-containing protein [Planctomycetota bacterium]